MTQSGTDTLWVGTASSSCATTRCRAARDRRPQARGAPPFDRQQFAAIASAARSPRARPAGSAPPNIRNQDGGGCWSASATSRRARSAAAFARGAARRPPRHRAARLDARQRPTASAFRYAVERADDTGASTLDRAIGSASQRQQQPQPLPLGARRPGRACSPARGEHAERELQRLRQRDRPRASRAAAHVPEPAGRRVASACRRPPTRTRFQLADTFAARAAGATRSRRRRRWQRVDGALRPRRLPRGPRRAGRRTSRTSTSTATAGSTTTTCCSR